MQFNEYQFKALRTEKDKGQNSLIISLLGLAGEAGELLSAYKKYLRDGDAHELYTESIKEELGDLLWYLTNTASKFNISLEDIADANLSKVKARWLQETDYIHPVLRTMFFYDAEFPESEQLPRKFVATIKEERQGNVYSTTTHINGHQAGDPLTDNAYQNDGYRYHDIFHLSYVAVLGWSPVIRKHVHRKRRSSPQVNEVEDGGRAAVIEEGISALIFAYAKQHRWLEGVQSVDDSLLKTVMTMAAHLEVKDRTAAEWEKAILNGYAVWREIIRAGGGEVYVDMFASELSIVNAGDHSKMTTAVA